MKTILWLLPRFALSLGMLAFIVVGAEAAFTRYVIISDSLAITNMHLRWVEKYWYPENSLGYRDTEWTEASLSGKTRILVLGDSFPAGHGVNLVADRFGNVLNQKLGDTYAVMLAAQPGFDTDQEIIALRNYPHRADALVFSYFLNDIVPACKTAAGIDPYIELGDIQPAPNVQKWLNRSNLLDYLYWSVYIRQTLANRTEATMDTIGTCYSDETIWGYHSAQLQTIYNWAYLKGIPLVVVIFPHLGDTSLLPQAITHVEEFFTSRQVRVINQTEVWSTYPVQDRVANHLDWHPSLKIHHEVGELLAQESDLQWPTDQLFRYAWAELLLPNVYANYLAQKPEALIQGKSVFIAGAGYRDFFLNVAEATNLGFYMDTAGQSERYQLIEVAENLVVEEQLPPESETALNNWRNSKSGADLHALGFDYLLIDRLWRGWLTPEEFEALTQDYEVVKQWEFPEYSTDYQLLRAKG